MIRRILSSYYVKAVWSLVASLYSGVFLCILINDNELLQVAETINHLIMNTRETP